MTRKEKISKSLKEQWAKGERKISKKFYKFWLGKKRDRKTVEALRKAHLGKFDEKAARWLGDKVGYDGLHDWVYKKLGKPMICNQCGKKCKNNYKIHWANKSGKYKRNIRDWVRLCVKCHWWKDQVNRPRKGNKWI